MTVREWFENPERDADIEVEVDEADDLLVALESLLRDRQRNPEAVRIEVASSMPQRLRARLLRELGLAPSDLYVIDGLLDLGEDAQDADHMITAEERRIALALQ